MSKSKKTAFKAASNAAHLFMHRTRSGNVVSCSIVVPRLGHVSRFDAHWVRSPSAADLSEQEMWLASVAQTSAAIGGRHLTLRFVDERGRAVEFAAEKETEAAA